MKRKRKGGEEGCDRCEHRKGSLSEMPSGQVKDVDEESVDSEAKRSEEDMYSEVLREEEWEGEDDDA
jgi:hypothetical protein